MVLTPPLSFTWEDMVDRLILERGSLAEVVRSLYDLHPKGLPDDPQTVERGLRRLRSRGSRPADKYGRLILKSYGLPATVAQWARSLGTYHGPLIDLPLRMRKEQLRLWDRAPVIESREAAWIHLAQASVAHHEGRLEELDRRLDLAALGARRAGDGAVVELGLFRARRLQDAGQAVASRHQLDELAPTVQGLEGEDGECFRARWLDQRAYLSSRAWRRDPDSLDDAEALCERISAEGPAFVRHRRSHSLAWVRWRKGAADAAEHGRLAIQIAGDGGLRRLRASSLKLLAHIVPTEREVLQERVQVILAQLDD